MSPREDLNELYVKKLRFSFNQLIRITFSERIERKTTLLFIEFLTFLHLLLNLLRAPCSHVEIKTQLH